MTERRSTGRTPDAMDREIGERIRNRRVTVGMTLSSLSGALGISYQQVQKYEKGLNRVSSSRLHQIADLLGTGVTHLYGANEPTDPARITLQDRPLLELMRSRDGRRLVESFHAMSPSRRKALLSLMETMRAQDSAEETA